MSLIVRPALGSDQGAMADLLLLDAKKRQAQDSALWAIRPDARECILAALKSSMETENPPFRQQWLVAEAEGAIVGLTHSILLPVPPIYAGVNGPPGLIMEDCFVSETAPKGAADALLASAEDDLRAAGAKVLLASTVVHGTLEYVYRNCDYEPLTLYLASSKLTDSNTSSSVRNANEEDIADIVALSATHRRILHQLDAFWEPHPEADARFANWMTRSLTLEDRDMFVVTGDGVANGYAISQPATPLHFPPAHDISATGVIDDFYHVALQDPARIGAYETSAMALFEEATAALKVRGGAACLVVCPAAWTSKIALLEKAGFSTALIWLIKR